MIRKHSLSDIIKGISALVLFLLYDIFALLPLQIFQIDVENLSFTARIIYGLTTEIILIFVIFLIFRNYLKECFDDFKKNNRLYFKKYLKYWFIALGVMMFSNLIIISFAPGSVANNEQAILETFKKAPLYTFVASVLLAPFLEECIFRLGFRLAFKNDLLFIIASGIVFGALHVIGGAATFIDYLYIIPYSAPGIVFAYTLCKSDNIFVPMGLHFMHNGILMSLQFFLLFFGA